VTSQYGLRARGAKKFDRMHPSGAHISVERDAQVRRRHDEREPTASHDDALDTSEGRTEVSTTRCA
jgi:hypothetical protein